MAILKRIVAAGSFQTAFDGGGVTLEDVELVAQGIYQIIAADTSAPREVRARALLLAGCEEKLGASPSYPVNSYSIGAPSA